LGFVAAAAGAVQMGAAELERRAAAAESPAPAPTIPVSASPIDRHDGYSVKRAFIGQVEPQRSALVSFELPGRLARILVDEGDAVTEGQILALQGTALIEADRARLEASRRSVEAQLRFARQTVERTQTLSTRGFSSEANVDEALARVDDLAARIAEIDAALADNALRLGKAEVRAPFAGRVTERLVDGGETMGAGQAILRLVQVQTPRVRVGVPLDLDENALTSAEIEIGGAVRPARLLTLRPDIDPVTRTRTALFELDAAAPPVFGQTARLIARSTVDADGAWVATTSLKEGLRGQWSVLVVDADQVVRPAAVEVLHAESDRVYVRGAFPDGTVLVDAGPQRVTAGQRVSVQFAWNEE
jgi:RND family efflux transporter MFP subunit